MNPEYALNKSLPYLTGKLEEVGIAVQVGINQTRGTMFLLLNGCVKCSIHELISALIAAEPDAHRAMMEPWIPYLMERTRIGETMLNNPDELRRLIRTEFALSDGTPNQLYSSARQYPGNLLLTLSLDYDTPLFRLDNEQLAQCPLSVDELFYYAQMNTDNVPIERVQQLGPFTCLSAQSTFVTAKAANMPALMSRFRIHAPYGLFLLLPANHVVYYAPVDPANIYQQLMSIASFSRLPIFSASQNGPNAVLSRDIFYYSPEGTYETITRADNPALQEFFGNPYIDTAAIQAFAQQYLSPSPAFRQRFLSR